MGIELQLTPMIDCVFLLMVYFLWSSSFAVAELSLPSRLTAAASGSGERPAGPPPEADFDSVVVRVLGNSNRPAWAINNVPVESLTAVQQTLTRIAGINHEVPIVIDPESDVPLGDVIDVFDLARLAGFIKVQFAASVQADQP